MIVRRGTGEGDRDQTFPRQTGVSAMGGLWGIGGGVLWIDSSGQEARLCWTGMQDAAEPAAARATAAVVAGGSFAACSR